MRHMARSTYGSGRLTCSTSPDRVEEGAQIIADHDFRQS